jgi:predicted nucleotidyltransferase
MNASAANLALLRTVALRLGPLRERVVFLGGATIALLITDADGIDIRATNDVDVIVEVSSYFDYQHTLRNELLNAGFREDTSEGAPTCRWLVDGVKVDVMPTDAKALGFSNSWYPEAIRHAEPFKLPGDIEIRLITSPYLLATKLEAFRGRGDGDFAGSTDIEDIILIIHGRPSVLEEVRHADATLRNYLAQELWRRQ